MKRLAILVLPLVLAGGCTTSSSPAAKGGPAPAPAAEPTPTAEQQEKAKALVDQARLMAGVPEPGPDEDTGEPWIIVTDEATGRKLERIPKGPTLRVVGNKLQHSLLNPKMFSVELVREDEKYYYVAAPDDAPRKARARDNKPPDDLRPIFEVPESEYEVVTPKVSRNRLRFEEKSEGLPRSGFWRSNMEVADLDGDGTPEIVTTPPRLSTGDFRVFKFGGTSWQPVEITTESAEEGLGFSYGGVAVADVNGDGKPDVITIGHGSGPMVAYNLGGWRFRLEARGLPRSMSGRAIAAGDVDGDGRLDIVAISDEPESLKRVEERDRAVASAPPGAVPTPEPEPAPGGHRPGIDARLFLQRPDGSFTESTAGLDQACYAYTLGLAFPPKEKGSPFFVSGCHYVGGRALLYEWDAVAKAFRHVGRGVVEEYSVHNGAATGTYRGLPAAFASWVKGTPPGVVDRPMVGHGVSVYYREASGWKAKRIVKVVKSPAEDSQGLGVGDLNGDGLDDVVWADDSVGRVRVFFQTPRGEFEELDPELQPKYINHSMSVKVVDVDRDGRKDIVLMYEFRSTDKTRAGGLRFFRNAG